MKIVGVISGKGGVGKTTLVANIAAVLSSYKKTLIIDSNIKTSSVCFHFGFYKFENTLNDVLSAKVPINSAVYLHEKTGVNLLLPSLSFSEIGLRSLRNRIKELKGFEIVLVDSSPGLGLDAVEMIRAVDEILIITTPDLPSVTDAIKAIQLANKLGKPVKGIVVNRIKGEKNELTAEEIEFVCSSPVLCSVPEDSKVSESIFYGSPIVSMFPSSGAAKEFKRLALALIGREYKKSFSERIKEFFENLPKPKFF